MDSDHLPEVYTVKIEELELIKRSFRDYRATDWSGFRKRINEFIQMTQILRTKDKLKEVTQRFIATKNDKEQGR